MDAKELISALGINPDDKVNRSKIEGHMRIAVVDPSYGGSGLPKLRFYGESTIGARQYPHLGSYTPAANDVVLVWMFSHSGCVLGKVINS